MSNVDTQHLIFTLILCVLFLFFVIAIATAPMWYDESWENRYGRYDQDDDEPEI